MKSLHGSIITTTVLLLQVGYFAAVAHGQTPASSPSLAETVRWMDNFSATHGLQIEKQGPPTTTYRLIGEDGCSVRLEMYNSTTKPNFVRYMSSKLLLGDLDPNSVSAIADQVTFETTDSAAKNETDVEMGDGRRDHWKMSSGWLYLDSEESAHRFARALAHAITECGGTSAPF